MRKVPKLRFKEFSDEWEEKRLEEISEIIGGGTPSSIIEEYWNGEIQWFTPTEIGKTKYVEKSIKTITKLGLENSSAKLLPKGTILLSSRATIGEKSITLNEVTTNQGFQSIQVKKGNYNEFIYYLLDNLKSELIKKATGSTFLEISAKVLRKIKIRLPTLKEQKKIADFFISIDKKISLIEKKLELLKKYKKGIIQKIFSKELRFKDYEGNDYPEWNLFYTKDISKITIGFTPSTKDEMMWNGKYKWLSIADLKANGKYISKTSKTITEKGIKNKKILPKGTLIMSFKLTLGKLGIISDNMFTNEAICHFHWLEKNKINTEYIYYYLSDIDITNFGKQAVKGITLNTESLNSIEIQLPILEEQQKIADFLSAIDKKIENIEKELKKLKELKKGLLQQIIL